MTPTATYIADENCLQEISQMEKPLNPRSYLSKTVRDLINREWQVYDDYINSLRKIPCSPEPGFKDGEKYTEGADYEIKGAGDWKWCYQLKGNIFAAPLVPAGEEELWREAISVIKDCVKRESWDTIMAELKSKYSLTKR